MKFKSAHFFFCFITFQKKLVNWNLLLLEHESHSPSTDKHNTLKNYPVSCHSNKPRSSEVLLLSSSLYALTP